MAKLPENYEVIMEIGFACTNGTEFIVANAKKVRDIVRCRDCKWRHDDSNPQYLPCTDWYPQDNFFCAYGEREDDG